MSISKVGLEENIKGYLLFLFKKLYYFIYIQSIQVFASQFQLFFSGNSRYKSLKSDLQSDNFDITLRIEYFKKFH